MVTIDTLDSGSFAFRSDARPLTELPLGTTCRVVAVDEESVNLLHLMEMGLVPGAQLVIERAAPLRHTYSLRLAGCSLAVRREDACRVLVVALPDSASCVS